MTANLRAMLMAIVAMRVRSLLTCVVFALVGACDKQADAPPVQDQAAKEAEARKARLAERAKKREAEAAAAKAAEEEKQRQIDALLVLPAKLPKKLNKACAAVGAAHKAFVERHFDAEAAAKAASGTAMTVKTCNQVGSIKVAACQKQALDQAPTEFKKDLPQLLRGCIEKFKPGEQPT